MTALTQPAEWLAAPTPDASAELLRDGVPRRLADLLARRGVRTAAEAERFLSPSVDQLHDPRRLAGLPIAVERLALARQRAETVAIVGDYDVDGVTATALLMGVLQVCGIKALPILPNRFVDGYGFQPAHVERARATGCTLIVTVDCGITASAATEQARNSGLDVIVTDHHLPEDGAVPAGATVINPRQAGCEYPFADLAGVGLAMKLAVALLERLDKPVSTDALLRMACLGTIADVVPLLGENRVIAALGLEALGRTRSLGLLALMRRAGLTPPLKAVDVGFRIGPRLNAAGRLRSPDRALALLLSRDASEADELAAELEQCNRERQAEEDRMVDEGRARIESRRELPAILVLWSEGWHRGVVGIGASRLARDFRRPAVLLAVDGELATGSGRSVPGVELHSFLNAFRPRFERFGGHAQAVGLTVETAGLSALASELEAAAARQWPTELFTLRYRFELDTTPAEIAGGLLESLARLEPHGQSNSQPLARVRGLKLERPPRRFGRGHLSARAVGDDGVSLSLLGWRWAEQGQLLAGKFDALGYIEHDSYRGEPVLRLVDARSVS